MNADPPGLHGGDVHHRLVHRQAGTRGNGAGGGGPRGGDAGVFAPRLRDNVQTSGLTQTQQVQIIDQQDKLGGIEIPASFDAAAVSEEGAAIRESFIMSFRWTMALCAGLALLGSIISAWSVRQASG